MGLVREDDEYQMFQNKKPYKIYVSKQFEILDLPSAKGAVGTTRSARFASQVIDSTECHDFFLQKKETPLAHYEGYKARDKS